jgi:hypothetical protein
MLDRLRAALRPYLRPTASPLLAPLRAAKAAFGLARPHPNTTGLGALRLRCALGALLAVAHVGLCLCVGAPLAPDVTVTVPCLESCLAAVGDEGPTAAFVCTWVLPSPTRGRVWAPMSPRSGAIGRTRRTYPRWAPGPLARPSPRAPGPLQPLESGSPTCFGCLVLLPPRRPLSATLGRCSRGARVPLLGLSWAGAR